MSARSPIGSTVATTRGDDGSTGLLFGGARIQKDDPRTEAYGTVDEAVAALGVARANLGVKRRIGTLPAGLGGLAELILRFQRELFVVGAELATNPEAWDRLEDGRTRVSEAMVRDLERDLVELEQHIEMPREFVVPGETPTSAALELARTILRRGERRAVALQREALAVGADDADPVERARLHAELSGYLRHAHEHDESADELQTAIELLPAEAELERLALREQSAKNLMLSGHFREGIAEAALAAREARRLGATKVETSVWYGPPVEAITDAAQLRKADLIVMSSHGRTGLGRLILGSVAESVLRATSTPILLLRPEAPSWVGGSAKAEDTYV